MGEETGISWTDSTFSPWIGCQKVGPGCDHCYAEAQDQRFTGGKHWGPGAERRRTSAAYWRGPYKWSARRIFAASQADIFDNAVPREWRDDFWDIVRAAHWHEWQIVTKRIGNVADMLPADWLSGAFDSVVLIITVCDQEEADRDVPKLLAVPRTERQLCGISYEPALGPIDFETPEGWLWRYDDSGRREPMRGWPNHPRRSGGIDWVICGAESGPHARPMQLEWARAVRDQCAAAGVAFFMKQLCDGDGKLTKHILEFPVDLQVQQFPTAA